MNLPTKLTIARLLATPVFVVLLSISFTGNYTLALILFLLAMITDYIDGSLARSRREVTDVGKLLDPLADKILISSAFITFIELKEILLPAWLVIIIVSREFAITGLRLVAACKGMIIPAGKWGKHKTLSQVITVSAVLIYLCLYYDKRVDMPAYRPLILALVGLTTVFTLSSGCYYLIKNIGVLIDHPPEEGNRKGEGEGNRKGEGEGVASL